MAEHSRADRREFEGYQAFLADAKAIWATELFGDLKRTAEERQAIGPGASAASVADAVADHPAARTFAFLERRLQALKYTGRLGIVPFLERHRADHAEEIAPDLPDGLLGLDPELKLPAYYCDVDVHQQPGGVWREDIGGLSYAYGARGTTGRQVTGADGHGRAQTLHTRFADLLGEAAPDPGRIADLGCGYGKSTLPIAEAFPDAAIDAVDLSAPCLRLAARTAFAGGIDDVRFHQADAAATGLAAGAYGLVTSTMLLHEMPPSHVRAVFAEARRLLAPGAAFMNLDFLPPDDPFLAFIHAGHGERNNEPWMATLARMDLPTELAAAGFRDVTIAPFEEFDGALATAGRRWRLPFTVIAARAA